jgi:hypothetical protein
MPQSLSAIESCQIYGFAWCSYLPSIEITISLLALVVAAMSLLRANASHRLARQVYKDSLPIVHMELLAANSVKQNNATYLFANIIFSNPSDRDLSIKRLELRLDYVVVNRQSNMILPCSDVQPSLLRLSEGEIASIGTRISSRGTVVATAIFKLDTEIYSQLDVSMFEIIFTDTAGKKYSMEVLNFSEVANRVP